MAVKDVDRVVHYTLPILYFIVSLEHWLSPLRIGKKYTAKNWVFKSTPLVFILCNSPNMNTMEE